MAGPYWMAVTLAVLLFAGNSLAKTELDQIKLKDIVNHIRNRFTPTYRNKEFAPSYTEEKPTPPMFSLAVSIPYNKDINNYDTSKVTDNVDRVRNTILDCEVYTSNTMVAATVLRWRNVLEQCPKGRVQWPDVVTNCRKNWRKEGMTWADVQKLCPENAIEPGRADHAEYRTLQHIDTLVKSKDNKQDLLLFYVRDSPCPRRCTDVDNLDNILTSINQIKNWKNYAVVFSGIFQPRDGPEIREDVLMGALVRLGTFKGPKGPIGLDHIFRCNKDKCVSCGDNNKVMRYCFSRNESPESMSSILFEKPQQGGSGQGAQGKQWKNIGGQGGRRPDVGKGSQKNKGKQKPGKGQNA